MIAAIMIVFIGIDAMAFLAMPTRQDAQTRTNLIAWADMYMKAHAEQSYQYSGKDLYGARCAALHAFAAEAEFHRKNADVKYYGYNDDGYHYYDPDVNLRLVIVGIRSFTNDFVHAVDVFMKDIETDAALRKRVEARLPKIYARFPFPQPAPDSHSGSPPAPL